MRYCIICASEMPAQDCDLFACGFHSILSWKLGFFSCTLHRNYSPLVELWPFMRSEHHSKEWKKIETDDFPKKSEMFTYLPMCWTERCITSKKQLLIFYSTFLMSSVTKGGNRTKANIICTNKRVNIFTLLTKINKKFRHCLRS